MPFGRNGNLGRNVKFFQSMQQWGCLQRRESEFVDATDAMFIAGKKRKLIDIQIILIMNCLKPGVMILKEKYVQNLRQACLMSKWMITAMRHYHRKRTKMSQSSIWEQIPIKTLLLIRDLGVREADTTCWANSIFGYFKWFFCSL